MSYTAQERNAIGDCTDLRERRRTRDAFPLIERQRPGIPVGVSPVSPVISLQRRLSADERGNVTIVAAGSNRVRRARSARGAMDADNARRNRVVDRACETVTGKFKIAASDPGTRAQAQLILASALTCLMKHVVGVGLSAVKLNQRVGQTTWILRVVLDSVGDKLYRCAVPIPVSYTHLRAHETGRDLVCRLLLEKKKHKKKTNHK